jgi:hypothetical protein
MAGNLEDNEASALLRTMFERAVGDDIDSIEFF